MYTDSDLTAAVNKGIFSKQAVADFRAFVEAGKHTTVVDEEHFRLITGFNDIFVVLIAMVLMFSASWLLEDWSVVLSAAAYPVIAWGLSEIYVRQRRMALPAVVFLITYAIGIHITVLSIAGDDGNSYDTPLFHSDEIVMMVSLVITALATWGHWIRFKVPITIAAAAFSVFGFIVILFGQYTDVDYKLIMFVCGMAILSFAMYWDMSDLKRLTRRSDIAFWLHLLAAPLIVHPVFDVVGMFESPDITDSIVVVILYVLLSIVSLAINRRSFMVSALFYVIYAISEVVASYSSAAIDHVAVTGVMISVPLLILAAYWHSTRALVMVLVPESIQRRLPPLNT